MKQSRNVKIVVFVPESHADAVRVAAAKTGAGRIGRYVHCSFSSKGTGRFTPEAGAKPMRGEIGKEEMVEEERIEFLCDRLLAKDVVEAVKNAHPYEEVALDIYPLEDF